MTWDFCPDTEFACKLDWIEQFVDEEILPLEPLLPELLPAEAARLLDPLKEQVKAQGLWAAHLPKELGGTGLGQLALAQMNMITGRVGAAMEVFGNMAPDSGNAELLADGGTPEQKERWLWPNLRGDIRSAFAITEPWVSSTDPTQIQSTAVLDGDHWVLNGRKWMITNASVADFIIFMVLTEPEAPIHLRYSMIIVERGTPGMTILRDIPSMHDPVIEYGRLGNHAEILLDDVRVPEGNLIGTRGHGFVLSQVRLGPGRLHHATRWLGEAERAFDMMCERAHSRSSFGKSYTRHQMVQEYITDSRIELETAKLLTLRAAWRFDREGNQGARSDIAMCKVYNAEVVHNVVDRALQVHGSLGYTSDMPLEYMYRMARMAPLVDGANEVHKVTIAKEELKRYQGVEGWPTEHVPTRLKAARTRFAHLLEAGV
ncbi:acyl-CoA dehydrogenase family protein [Mycobacterium sp. GA-2829]|uniref:acyl-CoA dehydrogenase family protein n=1 Tax=Mycobacterium sp. GA-2829 TaxID=1772283 RepID=UPI00074007A3|nr:acyl-CoA dehydrogenase family protein [Mycobacterium sp. GA-2829]KUI29318.1 acyl-CoA dehydrogenase [Mycobacterium sp. GA-2829]